jgi:hypothetical protein
MRKFDITESIEVLHETKLDHNPILMKNLQRIDIDPSTEYIRCAIVIDDIVQSEDNVSYDFPGYRSHLFEIPNGLKRFTLQYGSIKWVLDNNGEAEPHSKSFTSATDTLIRIISITSGSVGLGVGGTHNIDGSARTEEETLSKLASHQWVNVDK